MSSIKIILPGLIAFIFLSSSHGQYFGKNKVNYEQFDFEIYETPHFIIHHYLENEVKLTHFAQLCERWYLRHKAVFLDTFPQKNPIILYNNHADFQQTTVIQSIIGVGTGGVTEGMRNRVVMPLMLSNAETNHVLGHEMVHVFQYNSFRVADSINFRSIGNIPLWMIEGLAEYMSIGKSDVQTAMWMRDAVKNNNIPTTKEMTRKPYEYFPYRYGHAFWVFVTSRWGDAMVKPLLYGTARIGYRRAIDSLLGVSADSLSVLWKDALEGTFGPYEEGMDGTVGEKILQNENLGDLNIAPSISPDGRYVIFLSNKDVITTDFYLADMKKKKIVKKLRRATRDAHIDDYSFLESSGSWSPDNSRFALTSFIEGENRLVVINMKKLKPDEIYEFPELEYFNNPAWSPDGKTIAVAGLKNGQSDLFLLDLETRKSEQITDDLYSEMQPNWSPDGKNIVFISDRSEGTDFDKITYGKYRICTYNLETNNLQVLNFFPEANSSNPHYAADGEKIYFVSSANGIPNIYEYDLTEDQIYQLSDFYTGISGITEMSPSLSVARDTALMMYIHYNDNGYELYKTIPHSFDRKPVNKATVNKRPTILPPRDEHMSIRVVDKNLDEYPLRPPSLYEKEPYKPRLSLEYIGSSGIGVGVGVSQNTTALAGGVSFLFSDMLKRNQIMAAISVQGQIYDIGGQVMYLNQSQRFNWGVSLTHIPYRSTQAFFKRDTLDESAIVNNLVYLRQRTFEDQIGFFAQYPLSKRLRFEGGVTGSMYSFRIDSINNYYSPGGFLLDRERTKIESPDAFFVYNTYVAYVGDGANYGLTSPMQGYRYRFQFGRTFGRVRYWNIQADYRKYYFVHPVGLAFRTLHYGRYGGNSDELYPFFIGNQFFTRGYNYRSFYNNQCITGDCISLNQLTGSKMALFNMEVRYPFSGPKRLALIKSGFLFSDLVLFGDAGLSWFEFDNIGFDWHGKANELHIPVFSAGLALRVNLFGALIVEPYYAIPFQRNDIELGTFGFHLSAGGW
jgi:Tol biopolymer transport system component